MVLKLNNISKTFEQNLIRNNIRGYALTLEFESIDKEVDTDAKFSRGDLNTSVVAVQLMFRGEPIVLEENTNVYANIARTDGKIFTNDCEILDAQNGCILISFKTQSIGSVGVNRFEIVLKHSDMEKLISPKVKYTVYQAIDSELNFPAEDEISVLDGLINNVKTLQKEVGDFLFTSDSTFKSKIQEISDLITTSNISIEEAINRMNITVQDWFDSKVDSIVENIETLDELNNAANITKDGLDLANLEAKSNINILSEKNIQAEELISSINEKNSIATEKNTLLEETIIEAASKIDLLSETNTVTSTNIANLTTQNLTAASNIESLDSKNSIASANVALLIDKNNEAAFNIESLNDKNLAASNNIKNLDNKNSTANTNIANLDSKNSTANTTNNNLSSTISRATDANTTLSGNISVATERINDLAKNISNANNNITTLSEANSIATNNISNLNKQNSTANGRISSLESQNTAATSNISTLSGLNNSASANSEVLSEKNSTARSNIDALEAANTAASQNITNLNSKNSTAADNITKLTSKITAADSSSDSLTSKIAEGTNLSNRLDSANATAKQNKSDLDVKNSAASSNISSLTSKITEGNGVIQTLTGKITDGNTVKTQLQDKITIAEDIVESIGGFEGLIGDFSEDLSGNNIKIDKSYSSNLNNIIIEGKTYQNVMGDYTLNGNAQNDEEIITLTGNGQVNSIELDSSLFKSGVEYTIIVEIIQNTVNGIIELSSSWNGFVPRNTVNDNSVGIRCFKITRDKTTGGAYNEKYYMGIFEDSTKGIVKFRKPIALEGDYTNNPNLLSYFEGIKSVGEQENNKIEILSNGKNLFNGIFEERKGWVNKDTGKVSYSDEYDWHATDFIEILPNRRYYTFNFNSNLCYCFYDSNKNYINGHIHTSNKLAMSPQNAKFIRMTSIGTLMAEFMLTTEETTTYEPYISDKSQISLSSPLRSLPNGVRDTIEKIDGEYKVVRRIREITLNGSENWIFDRESIDSIAFSLQIPDRKDGYGNMYCDRFSVANSKEEHQNLWDGTTNEMLVGWILYNTISIRIKNSKLSSVDLTGFKQWFSENPTTVLYELTTPVYEELPKDIQYELEHIKTFQEVTHITTTNNIKPNLIVNADKSIGGVVKDTVEKVDIIERDLFNAETTISGESFKLENTINGTITGIKLEGKTYQNLSKSYNIVNENSNIFFRDFYLCDVSRLKIGSTYTLIYDFDYSCTGHSFAETYVGYGIDGVMKTQTVGKNGKFNTISGLTRVLYTHVAPTDATMTQFLVRPYIDTNKVEKTITFKNVMLLEGDWTNKEIPPYFEGIKGVGELDTVVLPNGVCDEEVSGKITKKVGKIILDGSENDWAGSSNDWQNGSILSFFTTVAKDMKVGSHLTSDYSSNFLSSSAYFNGEEYIGNISVGNSTDSKYIIIGIKKSRLSTANLEGFKKWLDKNPITVWYELATPVDETEDRDYKIEVSSNNKNLFDASKLVFGSILGNVGKTFEQNYHNVVGKTRARFPHLIKVNTNTQYVVNIPTGYKCGVHRYLNNICLSDTLWQTDSIKINTGEATHLAIVFRNVDDSEIDLKNLIDSEIMLEEGSNSTSYEFYKEDKKQISINEPLHQLPNGVKDTIELINGKYCVRRRVKKIIFNGSEDWNLANQYTTHTRFVTPQLTNPIGYSGDVNILCDKISGRNKEYVPSFDSIRYILGSVDDNKIYININISSLSSNSVSGFKEWLSNNPITVLYELAEEVIEPLSNEDDLKLKTLRTYDGSTHINFNTTVKPYATIELYDRSVRGLIDSNRHRIESLENYILEMRAMMLRLTGVSTLEEPPID